jgi:type IV pilus assembly protein PilA
MRTQKGFSLIELLIVVGIILIIAAIAVPALTRARVSANESSAVGSLRTINTAEISYASAYPNLGFATSLPYLGGPVGAACVPSTSSGCFLDSVLSSGTKTGYTFALAVGSSPAVGGITPSYSVVASPQNVNFSGARYFCSFEDGVVRSTTGSVTPPCTAVVPPQQ